MRTKNVFFIITITKSLLLLCKCYIIIIIIIIITSVHMCEDAGLKDTFPQNSTTEFH